MPLFAAGRLVSFIVMAVLIFLQDESAAVLAIVSPKEPNPACEFEKWSGMIKPDPNPCGQDGPTKCCNCMYERDIEKRKRMNEQAYVHWQRQAGAKLAEQARKRTYSRGPGRPASRGPPPRVPNINLSPLDIFQGDLVRREEPSSDGRETFTFRCWIILADEELSSLLPASFWHNPNRMQRYSRQSRMFSVRCKKGEGIFYYSEKSRRNWQWNSVDGSPSMHLRGARCMTLNKEQWIVYQEELKRQSIEVVAKLVPESQVSFGESTRTKSRTSQMIISQGNQNSCLRFPRLSEEPTSNVERHRASDDYEPLDPMHMPPVDVFLPIASSSTSATALLSYVTTGSRQDPAERLEPLSVPAAEAEIQVMMDDPLRWDPLDVHGAFVGDNEDFYPLSLDLSQALQVSANHPVTHETYQVNTFSPTSQLGHVAVSEISWFREVETDTHAVNKLTSIDELQLQACLTAPLINDQITLYAELMEIVRTHN